VPCPFSHKGHGKKHGKKHGNPRKSNSPTINWCIFCYLIGAISAKIFTRKLMKRNNGDRLNLIYRWLGLVLLLSSFALLVLLFQGIFADNQDFAPWLVIAFPAIATALEVAAGANIKGISLPLIFVRTGISLIVLFNVGYGALAVNRLFGFVILAMGIKAGVLLLFLPTEERPKRRERP